MAKVAITEQYLKDIADAIRTRKGAIGNIATPNMANGILNIAGGTGAFKVNSIEAIANLEDMQEGDYCVVDNIDTYLLYQYNNNTWGDVTDEILYPSINVTPTTNNQTVEIPEGYKGLNVVNIDAVTSAIDANITPANIRLGASILGVDGNCEPDKPDQTKTVTPTTQDQVITADTGYELGSVVVQGVTSDVDQNITSRNIKKSVQILGVAGTYSTGAYKVSSIEQMNSIDDMAEGDYCILENSTEPVMPEVCTFTRYKKSWNLIKEDAKDHLFIFRTTSGNTCARSTTASTATLTPAGDTFQVNTLTNPEFIWKVVEEDGVYRLTNLTETHYLTSSGGLTTSKASAATNLSMTYYSTNAPISSHNDRTVVYCDSAKLWNSSYSNQSSAAAWQTNTAWRMYACELLPSNYKYVIYQYTNGAWVDTTDEVIYPIETVDPSTQPVTVNTPQGYLGMQEVQINAVTASIDANIVPNKILQGVNILGVTGNVIKATSYTVNSLAERTALTGVENGQYCLLKQTDNSKYYFRRFLGNIEDICAGKYDNDYVFMWSCYIYESSNYRFVTSINAKTDYGWANSYRETVFINTAINDCFNISKTDANVSHYVCTIEHYAGKTQFKWLDGNFMYGGTATYNVPTTSNVLNYMHLDDYHKYSDNTYAFHCYNSGSNYYFIGSYSYWFAGSHYVFMNSSTNYPPTQETFKCKLYYARKDTSEPYTLYQMQSGQWVDVTDEIMSDIEVRSISTNQTITPNNLAPFCVRGYNVVNVLPPMMSVANIIPSTTEQNIAPTGIDVGFNKVIVEPVTSNIDLNITPENIKAGVNILGITGNLEGDPEELNNAQAIVTNILEGYGGE